MFQMWKSSLKISFHKVKSTKDGLKTIREPFRNQKQEEYDSENREEKSFYLLIQDKIQNFSQG